MVDAKVAKRYARAFFLISKEKNVLDAVATDLKGLAQCLELSEDLRMFIRNPIFKQEERVQLVKNVFEKDVHPDVLNFLLFLIDKKRLNLIGDIINMFNELFMGHYNTQEADLITEREIDGAMLQELLKKISERSGKKIQLNISTDPELLGGFKLRIGGVVYDASLKTQLERFKESVISTV